MKATGCLVLLLCGCVRAGFAVGGADGPATSDGGGSPDLLVDPVLAPPRPVAPLSGSTVTTLAPRFRWEQETEPDEGARLEICDDPSCNNVLLWNNFAGDQVLRCMPNGSGRCMNSGSTTCRTAGSMSEAAPFCSHFT